MLSKYDNKLTMLCFALTSKRKFKVNDKLGARIDQELLHVHDRKLLWIPNRFLSVGLISHITQEETNKKGQGKIYLFF